MPKLIVAVLSVLATASAQFNTHYLPLRTGIVHLFEWKFTDIAAECENFLGPRGFGGVQTSPVNEYLVSPSRAWWERYQPVSYKIMSRSGTEDEFQDMVRRCNAAGVRIYVDVVINHMAAFATGQDEILGTDGTPAFSNLSYPGVPYTAENFHPGCGISDYQDPNQVRNCRLANLPDLNQTQDYVRTEIVNFMNKLLGYGVAGFRVDACKHMLPSDLNVIYNKLNYLEQSHGFWPFSKPFIYQEVIDLGNEKVSKNDYTSLGVVTEFLYSTQIGEVFRGQKPLTALENWGTAWGFVEQGKGLVFVDNHDNQRGHGAGGTTILTYKDRKAYTLASIFMLAHPYGVPRVMSSYAFSNSDQGPPADDKQAIISPLATADGQCQNGWVCEHRWLPIANMIDFRNTVGLAPLMQFQKIATNQIAFCRGFLGFVALNNDNTNAFNARVNTCLPAGTYCDLASGKFAGYKCTGKNVTVGWFGLADINIPANDDVGAIILHYKAMVPLFPTLSK
uniref:Alpha-amylase n=1 Tax=Simulium nigrimanum TaxID=683695 RepID=D1FPT6_SIMNI